MTRHEKNLEEARRIAAQPTSDKLDWAQGEEARQVILRLLDDAVMDYADGLKLLGALEWKRWGDGYHAAKDSYTETFPLGKRD